MESHKDLKVWQESMDLVVEIYKQTKLFLKEELYALTSQMKRSAVSIPSNIAEGAGRKGTAEFCRFLYIALGSASELETQVELAYRLNFINNMNDLASRMRFIKNMLSKLIKSLENKSSNV
ncbi:four helix bundle protein [Flavobacterium dauae]|uniref:four helix bundle protein n=1 Tax=Flavobacterium dauae TaxID=1563479 RepID=UPI00101B2EF2|nr:four helix bundle protein [Flavobacterium dauae]WLD22539.1 four helix bundle protein [Flavobacterium dauae]